jgi:hypothetical protein
MTYDEAIEFIGGRTFTIVDTVDLDTDTIRYKTDWLAYREAVPVHWNAVRVGQSGGEFRIPNATRSQALDAVTKNGAHSIFYVDERAAIVFYKTAA